MTARKGKAPALWVVLSSGHGWRGEFASGVFPLRRIAKAWTRAREPLNPTLTFHIVRYAPALRKGGRRK